jgi:hypothetical protein
MNNIAKAIKNINNNAEFSVLENDVNQITWLNGTTPISVADINAKVSELETAETNKENQKATDKANGNQKLLDLGLTQAEATALTGYTPPSEE